MFPNENNPNRDFQKGFDADERRRSRVDDRYQLRKRDRERKFQKQRRVDPSATAIGGSSDQDSTGREPQYASSQYAPGGANVTSGQLDPVIITMLADLPNLVAGVHSGSEQTQLECTQRIRKLLSIERSPPIQQVIDSGVLQRLVELLNNTTHSQLQFEAAWALTNIASGTAEHTSQVIRHGGIPVFVKLLASETIEVQEQCVWALGNIAGDSPDCRNLVLQNGALNKLLALCDPRKATTEQRVSLLRNATWTLSNFCRGKPQPQYELIRDALPTLTTLLFTSDDDVLQDACWAFSYLSDVDGERGEDTRVQQAIVNSGALAKLVELLSHPVNAIKHPALRTIGNIVTGDDMQTQKVINLGGLVKILGLLSNEKKAIKKEACWAISNITAGNVEQIEHVISANLIPPLVHLLDTDEFDVQKEAAWGISNATSGGNHAQIRFLVNQGCIAPLCNLFSCPSPKIIMVALEGIENILRVGEHDRPQFNGVNRFAQFVEECGGLDKLEQVQSRDDIPDDIYEKAVEIVQEFWGEAPDDADDGGMDAQVAANGTQFAFGSGSGAPNASQTDGGPSSSQGPGDSNNNTGGGGSGDGQPFTF